MRLTNKKIVKILYNKRKWLEDPKKLWQRTMRI